MCYRYQIHTHTHTSVAVTMLALHVVLRCKCVFPQGAPAVFGAVLICTFCSAFVLCEVNPLLPTFLYCIFIFLNLEGKGNELGYPLVCVGSISPIVIMLWSFAIVGYGTPTQQQRNTITHTLFLSFSFSLEIMVIYSSWYLHLCVLSCRSWDKGHKRLIGWRLRLSHKIL